MVNTTFQLAPWADALFAMDCAWWQKYHKEVTETFQGKCYTVNNIGKQFSNLNTMKRPFTAHGNSGAGAVHMAARFGAAKIILLGYDCQHTNGKRHWHGDHPSGLGNACVVSRWPKQFVLLRDSLKNVTVINCTRKTALFAFPVGRLEEELCL